MIQDTKKILSFDAYIVGDSMRTMVGAKLII